MADTMLGSTGGELPAKNVTGMTGPGAGEAVVCYSQMMVTTYGIWQGVSPLEFSLPLFILQTAIIVGTTRLLVVLLKPFRQPRVIAEILVRASNAFTRSLH
jgi:hypothetical protein